MMDVSRNIPPVKSVSHVYNMILFMILEAFVLIG